MKNKGFTLVELLAVIVILAIIAIIAVPIVLNIVEDVKEESNQRSMELYAKAVENAMAKYYLKNDSELKGDYVQSNKGKILTNRTNSSIILEIDYDGDVRCNIIELYEDHNFYLGECIINESQKEYSFGNRRYNNGDEVYFDVKEGVKCKKSEYEASYDETKGDYLNSKTGYNGYQNKDKNKNITTKESSQNSCLKFYAFNDDKNKGTINLILDHNTTHTEKWKTDMTSKVGPNEVITSLNSDTQKWKGTETPSNYEYTVSKQDYSYVINYKGFKARLITANEIAKITGADIKLNWNEESSTTEDQWFYLDGKSNKWQTQTANSNKISKFYWLFDRTKNCTSYGCKISDSTNVSDNNGYWTASAINNMHTWFVDSWGSMGYYSDYYDVHVFSSSTAGVRPVIEVLKSKLN